MVANEETHDHIPYDGDGEAVPFDWPIPEDNRRTCEEVKVTTPSGRPFAEVGGDYGQWKVTAGECLVQRHNYKTDAVEQADDLNAAHSSSLEAFRLKCVEALKACPASVSYASTWDKITYEVAIADAIKAVEGVRS